MRASELVTTLQTDIDKHGDFDVRISGRNNFGDEVIWDIDTLAPPSRLLVVKSSEKTAPPRSKRSADTPISE